MATHTRFIGPTAVWLDEEDELPDEVSIQVEAALAHLQRRQEQRAIMLRDPDLSAEEVLIELRAEIAAATVREEMGSVENLMSMLWDVVVALRRADGT